MWSATKISSASGLGFLTVLFDGRQLLFVRAASVKVLHAANEEHLEGRHQRRGTRAIENLQPVGLRQINFEQAEVAHIGGHQVLQDGFAAPLAKEHLVAHEHVCRPQLAAFTSETKRSAAAKPASSTPSRMSLTRVCAKSRDMRCSAGESSSKKLAGSLRHLVLLAEQVRWILEQHLALAVGQATPSC